VVIAAQIVVALQTLVSRTLDPVDSAVVSVTQVHAGTTHNVIPGDARLAGTVRTFRPEVQAAMEAGLKRTAQGVAAAMGAATAIRYKHGYPATVNHAAPVAEAAAAAAHVVGADRVDAEAPPVMGAEDFSYMLQRVPGAYIWVGQAGGPGACGVHNPRYDFNDEILPIGASLFATLVERRLADGG
jgi:hippurate hydrolase